MFCYTLILKSSIQSKNIFLFPKPTKNKINKITEGNRDFLCLDFHIDLTTVLPWYILISLFAHNTAQIAGGFVHQGAWYRDSWKGWIANWLPIKQPQTCPPGFSGKFSLFKYSAGTLGRTAYLSVVTLIMQGFCDAISKFKFTGGDVPRHKPAAREAVLVKKAY